MKGLGIYQFETSNPPIEVIWGLEGVIFVGSTLVKHVNLV